MDDVSTSEELLVLIGPLTRQVRGVPTALSWGSQEALSTDFPLQRVNEINEVTSSKATLIPTKTSSLTLSRPLDSQQSSGKTQNCID